MTVREFTQNVFYAAIDSGCSDLIKWLVETFHVTKNEIPSGLAWYCKSCGNSKDSVATAEWLRITLNFESSSVWSRNSSVLLSVCESGYLDLAKWLTATFGNDPVYVKDDNERYLYYDAMGNALLALRRACKLGHLHIAEWLVETFAITEDTLRKDNFIMRLISDADMKNRRKTTKWLVRKFGLPENKMAILNAQKKEC